ncbi:hypothetical protein [Alkaliphilus peptidifermentans]|uniref:Uncharacterized protein n=1 Tax=Alkaliphilus peptidifermentans DSM 18978 TaxID=1120976 RepID=A0A1G5L8C2_9FIRM|nr:hypothetical protein [Alkaliphilus peptidifermentans]SCZ08419.1 hypothetical protein SAMN03080606_04115 [Alkaliphilus peptidifermentans DSM 18978]
MVFNRLFWGFLFILFDFRLQGFNVLPDIVGYIIIFSTLARLIEDSPHFERARKYAFPLIFLSILDIYEAPTNGININLGGSSLIVVISIIGAIINLMMVYNVLKGIGEMADGIKDYELMIMTEKRWRYYLFGQVAILSIVHLFLLIPLALFLFIPLFIYVIIVGVLILAMLKQADRRFKMPY